jgi:hypothetical protein
MQTLTRAVPLAAAALLSVLTGCSGQTATTSTAPSTSTPSAGAAAPLIGTWTAKTTGFGVGKENFRTLTWTVEITKAEGPAFEGNISFEGPSNFDPPKQSKPDRITGAVRADGSIHFVDTDGVFTAIPTGEGAYEMTYQEVSPDDQTFLIGPLTRS